MIAFLGAMDIEVDGIKEQLTDISVTKIGPYEFFLGKLHGREIVVAKCGIGKVSTASCATALIGQFHPELIVNTGVAGGLWSKKGMRTGDLVIGTQTVHHDADSTALGYAIGQVPEQPVFFDCDTTAADKFYELAKDQLSVNVFRGVIASGDAFVCSNERSAFIRDTFDAASCEMEGAALGQVCRAFDTAFCAIRSISDCADDDASTDYPTFEKLASANSIALVSAYVKAM